MEAKLIRKPSSRSVFVVVAPTNPVRDIRLEYNRTNKDAKFYHGVYVYVGRRNETEW